MTEEAGLTVEVVALAGGCGFAMPDEVVKRYHLAPGVRVEVHELDDGIMLVPIGVEPWFSPEWERALDFVVERYGTALGVLGEE